jgi:hypothetical protein
MNILLLTYLSSKLALKDDDFVFWRVFVRIIGFLNVVERYLVFVLRVEVSGTSPPVQ